MNQSVGLMNPIARFFGSSGGAIRVRIASKTCLSWARVFCAKLSWCMASSSVLCSSASSLAASSLWVARTSRSRTKARTTYTETSTARGELSTVAAIRAPCSVKASGSLRRPPRPWFDVAICDIKSAYSADVSWNMKSAGKRSAFRRTCSLSRRVSTPYRLARSLSRSTFCPRRTTMRRVMEVASSRASCSGRRDAMRSKPIEWAGRNPTTGMPNS